MVLFYFAHHSITRGSVAIYQSMSLSAMWCGIKVDYGISMYCAYWIILRCNVDAWVRLVYSCDFKMQSWDVTHLITNQTPEIRCAGNPRLSHYLNIYVFVMCISNYLRSVYIHANRYRFNSSLSQTASILFRVAHIYTIHFAHQRKIKWPDFESNIS